MPFYVPVGPRGVIFRIGSLIINVLGSITYWRSALKRQHLVPIRLEVRNPRSK